jgi:trehalose/maltose hydrolase-like predicted phosphorylase
MISDEELDQWRDITHKMKVVFHADGVLTQFEGYEQLPEFDWEGYREKYGNIQRLDRVLEAEGDSTDRYKVSKQADVLMLLYLLSRRELEALLADLGYQVTDEQLERTVDYYLARTSNGSTLSAVVSAWVLARYDPDEAWRFLQQALDSDIADVQGGTTSEGIHLGAMAGTVDMVLRCLTGMRARGQVLRFDPALPPQVKELRFSVHYRGTALSLPARKVFVILSKMAVRFAMIVDTEMPNPANRSLTPPFMMTHSDEYAPTSASMRASICAVVFPPTPALRTITNG